MLDNNTFFMAARVHASKQISTCVAQHSYAAWVQGESQELSSNPLHSCWAALLKRFMAAGDSNPVLRTLDANQALHAVSGRPWQGNRSCSLSQSEMEDLVESAYSAGNQGEQTACYLE